MVSNTNLRPYSEVRLQKELKAYFENPPPYIPLVHVNEKNILEWHFLIEGPPDSPYAGGWYIGKERCKLDPGLTPRVERAFVFSTP